MIYNQLRVSLCHSSPPLHAYDPERFPGQHVPVRPPHGHLQLHLQLHLHEGHAVGLWRHLLHRQQLPGKINHIDGT